MCVEELSVSYIALTEEDMTVGFPSSPMCVSASRRTSSATADKASAAFRVPRKLRAHSYAG